MGKETDENAEVERGGRRSSSLPASPLKDITDNVDEDEGGHNKRYSFRTRGARKSSIMESDEEEQEEEQEAYLDQEPEWDGEEEAAAVEDDDEDEDEDEEDGGSRRYPRRNRTSVVIYDPYEEPTVSRRRRGRRAEEEEEEEVMEDERMKPFGRYSADHRYSTRFRREPEPSYQDVGEDAEGEEGGHRSVAGHELRRSSRRVRAPAKRYTPGEEVHNQPQQSPRKRLRRIQRQRDRDSYRDHQRYGRRRIGGDSEDDLIQDRNDHLWGLLAEAAQQDAAATGGTASLNPQAQPPMLPTDLGRAFGANPSLNKQKNVEITPVTVDASITFSDIGGLEHYVHSLKEMVFLPLVYPEVFKKFHLNPPKGVLLHGPPGTGKTLCARALAAAAKRSGQNVSFFMRKGADVLSKWVGESERQLRLLFEEAQKRQPSIIFFDEIDGLCPVRSSKQDQIHNSIVSTLLALMDGLDNRGQVVVIGATNRIDAVDSALRRPGRFDRELAFPLPNVEARKEILGIHTKKWQNPMGEELKEDLATTCVGYCGADLKALCTEATLQALRRHYPQIYTREEKLLIDTEAVRIQREDFVSAQKSITPASQRSAVVHAKPLKKHLAKCLAREMDRIREVCGVIFDHSEKTLAGKLGGKPMDYARVLQKFTCRPRMCVCGDANVKGMGQGLISAALLHDLESTPCFAIGHPDLLAFAGAHTPEEALVSIICEARKAAPSILYLPDCDIWWATSSYLLRSTFLALMSDLLGADAPVLFLANCDCGPSEIPEDLAAVFCGNTFCMKVLSLDEKLDCFDDVMVMVKEGYEPGRPGAAGAAAAGQDLPLAPPEEQVLQGRALELKLEEEEEALRQLRMVLRNQCLKLLCEHRWRVFSEPLSEEERKEVEEKGKRPMDLLTCLRRIDQKELGTGKEFQQAVADIVATSESLYSDIIAQEARIISRAHQLADTVGLWVKTIPAELDAKCAKILDARRAEAKRKEEEKRAEIRVSSRRAGEVVDDSIKHLDPEAVARKLRQERRLAEEQEALEAKRLEEKEKLEREQREKEEAERLAAEGQGADQVEALQPPSVESLVELQAKLEGEVKDKHSVHDLDSFHACLRQLTWSYRREPNRNKVCLQLLEFL